MWLDDAEPAALQGIPPDAIGSTICGLAPGQRLVLVGADRRGVEDLLRADAALTRSVLTLAPADARGAPGVIERILDDLAELALARWPGWPGPDEAPNPWARAAAKFAAGGRLPRLRRADAGIEFDGLHRVAGPRGVVLLAEIDPASPRRARGTVEALEWCAARGASTVALLPHRPAPEPPYDRLLYDARAVRADAEPVLDRFIDPPSGPHHASETERRVKAALDRDGELGPLFACNQIVADAGLRQPRVDLLWRAGRIVVELDGPEHRMSPKFDDDRHRDFELMVAGYHVLRITNDQVATDLQRAIEKIRAVVGLRRGERTTR